MIILLFKYCIKSVFLSYTIYKASMNVLTSLGLYYLHLNFPSEYDMGYTLGLMNHEFIKHWIMSNLQALLDSQLEN